MTLWEYMVILVNKTISQFHTERGDVLEMICEKRKGLDLRRGIAIFLLLAMCWYVTGPLAAAEAFAADSVKVNFTYTKKITHSNVYSYDFKAVYGKESKIAYCVKPKVLRLEKGAYTAAACNAEIRKLVYYSYGYPGYTAKTKSYIASNNSDKVFAGTNGQLILFHRVLSYPYDSTVNKKLALYKLTKKEAAFVKKMYKAMKSWPAPPSGGSLSLSQKSVKGTFNSKTGLKETGVIKLNADAKNNITVTIPEGTNMIKQYANGSKETLSSSKVKAVTIAGGDSFRFTAPASKTGTYKSPAMTESQGVFNAYIIKKANRQDTVFGLLKKRSVAFDINWNAAATPLVSTSASIKDGGTDASTGTTTVVDKVSYSGLTPGQKYTAVGKLMDKETGKAIDSPEVKVDFTAANAVGTVEVKFQIDSKKYAGKSLVAFQKICQGEKVIASHEDIKDAAQTVTVKEEKPSETPEAKVVVPETTQPSEETTTAPAEETTVPAKEETTAPPSEEETTVPSEETTAAQPTEETTQPATEETTQPSEETPPTEETQPPTEETTSAEETPSTEETQQSTELPPAEIETESSTSATTAPSSENKHEIKSTAKNYPQTSVKGYGGSPLTGDEAHVAIAFLIMAGALLMIGCLIVFRKSLL